MYVSTEQVFNLVQALHSQSLWTRVTNQQGQCVPPALGSLKNQDTNMKHLLCTVLYTDTQDKAVGISGHAHPKKDTGKA